MFKKTALFSRDGFPKHYDNGDFVDDAEEFYFANITMNICTLPTVQALLKTKKQISLFSHPVWSLRGGVSHPHTSDSWWWSTTFINYHTSHERWMAIVQWILEMQLRGGKQSKKRSGDDDDDDNVDWTIDQEINDYTMHPHCTAQSWQRNRRKEKINRSFITHAHTSEPQLEYCL